jgi:hypothetical protein
MFIEFTVPPVATVMFAGILTTGIGITVMVPVVEVLQPFNVYVTEYVPAILAEIDCVVCPPGNQSKLPPLIDGVAVNIALPLGQMVSLFTVTVGNGFTVTLATAIDEQPKVVPVTV